MNSYILGDQEIETAFQLCNVLRSSYSKLCDTLATYILLDKYGDNLYS